MGSSDVLIHSYYTRIHLITVQEQSQTFQENEEEHQTSNDFMPEETLFWL